MFMVFGDASPEAVEEGIPELEKDSTPDAAFVNFPLFTLAKGRAAMAKLRARRIFGFHLPFEEDDAENYRKSAFWAAKRAQNMLGIPITLLSEPGQTEAL